MYQLLTFQQPGIFGNVSLTFYSSTTGPLRGFLLDEKQGITFSTIFIPFFLDWILPILHLSPGSWLSLNLSTMILIIIVLKINENWSSSCWWEMCVCVCEHLRAWKVCLNHEFLSWQVRICSCENISHCLALWELEYHQGLSCWSSWGFVLYYMI